MGASQCPPGRAASLLPLPSSVLSLERPLDSGLEMLCRRWLPPPCSPALLSCARRRPRGQLPCPVPEPLRMRGPGPVVLVKSAVHMPRDAGPRGGLRPGTSWSGPGKQDVPGAWGCVRPTACLSFLHARDPGPQSAPGLLLARGQGPSFPRPKRFPQTR